MLSGAVSALDWGTKWNAHHTEVTPAGNDGKAIKLHFRKAWSIRGSNLGCSACVAVVAVWRCSQERCWQVSHRWIVRWSRPTRKRVCPVSTGRLYFRKWGCLMTFTPEEDLAKHLRFIVEYEDGSRGRVCCAGGDSATGCLRDRSPVSPSRNWNLEFAAKVQADGRQSTIFITETGVRHVIDCRHEGSPIR